MIALVLLALAALVVGVAWPSTADVADTTLAGDLFGAARLWLGTMILLVLGVGLIVVLLVERGWIRDFGRIVNGATREIVRPIMAGLSSIVAPLVGLIGRVA